MLEPYDAKVSRTVLRRGGRGDSSSLFGDYQHDTEEHRYSGFHDVNVGNPQQITIVCLTESPCVLTDNNYPAVRSHGYSSSFNHSMNPGFGL